MLDEKQNYLTEKLNGPKTTERKNGQKQKCQTKSKIIEQKAKADKKKSRTKNTVSSAPVSIILIFKSICVKTSVVKALKICGNVKSTITLRNIYTERLTFKICFEKIQCLCWDLNSRPLTYKTTNQTPTPGRLDTFNL